MTKTEELEALKAWGTARQRELIDKIIECGGRTAAATALGISRGTLNKAIARLKRKASRNGHSPEHDMTETVPEGFHVKGVSTAYKVLEDGTKIPSYQWVKTAADKDEQIRLVTEAVQDAIEDYRGTSLEVEPPEHSDEDLLCVYPIGDHHLGALSLPVDTGQNYNLDLAERYLYDAVDKLVGLAPDAKTALLLNLGDFFHTDNKSNRTNKSGHELDVDGRYPKILMIGIKLMMRLVYRLLEKHERVIVQCLIGNHDEHTAFAISLMLSVHFENNPRVEVDTNPSVFRWLRFGKTLIGMHHGHTVKRDQLPAIMACDRAKDWGETVHRYFYTGHIHHDTLKEYPGCVVESFRTLAARDDWHHSQGYRSGRDMKLDVIHRDYGKVNRHIVGIHQINGGNSNDEE